MKIRRYRNLLFCLIVVGVIGGGMNAQAALDYSSAPSVGKLPQVDTSDYAKSQIQDVILHKDGGKIVLDDATGQTYARNSNLAIGKTSVHVLQQTNTGVYITSDAYNAINDSDQLTQPTMIVTINYKSGSNPNSVKLSVNGTERQSFNASDLQYTLKLKRTDFSLDSSTGLYKATFGVGYSASSWGVATGEYKFTETLNNVCLVGGACRYYLAPLDASDKDFGLSGTNSDQGGYSNNLDRQSPQNYRRYFFNFGLECNVTTPQTKTFTLYDVFDQTIDGYTYDGSSKTGILIQRYNTVAGTWEGVDPSQISGTSNSGLMTIDSYTTSNGVTNLDPFNGHVNSWVYRVDSGSHPEGVKVYIPRGGEESVVKLTITMQPYVRYRVVIVPTTHKNFIALGYPTDQIFGMVGCQQTEYTLTPQAQNAGNNYVAPGGTVYFKYSVNNKQTQGTGSYETSSSVRMLTITPGAAAALSNPMYGAFFAQKDSIPTGCGDPKYHPGAVVGITCQDVLSGGSTAVGSTPSFPGSSSGVTTNITGTTDPSTDSTFSWYDGASSFTVPSGTPPGTMICRVLSINPRNAINPVSDNNNNRDSAPACVKVDALPTGSVTGDCNSLSGNTIQDPDSTSTELGVDVYVGAERGQPGSKNILSTTTVSHKFSFDPHTYESSGGYNLATQKVAFYVYAKSVDSLGNVINGNTPKIGQVTIGYCNASHCGGTLSTTMTAGLTATIHPEVTIEHWVAPPFDSSANPTLSNPKFKVSISGPSTSTSSYWPYTSPSTSPSTNATLTANGTFTPSSNGVYTISWSLEGTLATAAEVLNITCGGSKITVGDQPYFDAQGSDTLVSKASGSTWNGVASIKAWNANGSNGTYNGSGSNLAVIATGDINGFLTNRRVGATTGLSDLAFANIGAVTVDPTIGMYGGRFAAMPDIPDYIGQLGTKRDGTLSGTVDPSTLSSGVYSAANDISLKGVVPAGRNITIVAEKSVYISGDITYDAYNLKNIPRLNVYPKGDIIVAPSVTEIHGVFIGQPSSGTFYSCGEAYTGYNYSDTHLKDGTCNKQLTIYGSVSASKMILARTFGSWSKNNGAAETFLYGPETWLGEPTPISSGNGSTTTTTNTGEFDNYISLPPVL